MEEQNQEMTKERKTMIAILVVGGAYILGCMVGGAKANKECIESYKKGEVGS